MINFSIISNIILYFKVQFQIQITPIFSVTSLHFASTSLRPLMSFLFPTGKFSLHILNQYLVASDYYILTKIKCLPVQTLSKRPDQMKSLICFQVETIMRICCGLFFQLRKPKRMKEKKKQRSYDFCFFLLFKLRFHE